MTAALLKLNDRPNRSVQRPLRVLQTMRAAQRWCYSMRILKVTWHRQSWLYSWLSRPCWLTRSYDGLANKKKLLLCTRSDNSAHNSNPGSPPRTFADNGSFRSWSLDWYQQEKGQCLQQMAFTGKACPS